LAREKQAAVAAEFKDSLAPCVDDLTDVFDGNPAITYEDSGHLVDSGISIVVERIARRLEACGLIRKIS
jgi:hypothetical protein